MKYEFQKRPYLMGLINEKLSVKISFYIKKKHQNFKNHTSAQKYSVLVQKWALLLHRLIPFFILIFWARFSMGLLFYS